MSHLSSNRILLENWRAFTGDTKACISNKFNFKVKVLRTREEQAEGFQNKPEPDDGFGLYFVYGAPETLGFWMKDVPYNLELLAFDEDGRLFQVIHLKANDSTIKMIVKPCSHVVEVREGTVEHYGIILGDILYVDGEW